MKNQRGFRLIHKKRRFRQHQVNFRFTIQDMVRWALNGMTSPYEIVDMLQRLGCPTDNSGNQITPGFARAWLRRINAAPVCEGSDWWKLQSNKVVS